MDWRRSLLRLCKHASLFSVSLLSILRLEPRFKRAFLMRCAARFTFAALLIAAVTCSLQSAASGLALQTGDVRYFYDELGRLVGVIDKNGDAAKYSYDAVGNLLSIQRFAATSIAVIEFTPNSGAVGAQVVIHGIGFSATSGQNTVTFNGVAATVTSSTTTEILTSVPAGATSGPIGVTSPAGSTTSSETFTVNSAASGAPAISGFSPAIGTPGSSVTISGADFESIAGNNKVVFNTTYGSAVSATTTSIAASVPQSGSGKITVATPAGTAVSAVDFFIPPSPYTAADVEYTGRMALGESRTISINTANKIGLMAVDAMAGQRLGLNLTGVTMTTLKVSVQNPNGSTLYTSETITTSGGFKETPLMLATGTYTVMIDPDSSYTGSVTLALSNISDVLGAITPGGPSVTVTTTVVGQNGRLTFNGIAGRRISLKAAPASFTSMISILEPNGTLLATLSAPPAGNFLDPVMLRFNGTHTIVVDPAYPSTGSVTLTLYDVVDVTGTITPGGSPQTVSITTPGQKGVYTFSGNSNQKISMKIENATIPTWGLTLKKPDGSILTQVGTGTSFIDPLSLPSTGTYTILVDPVAAATGNITLTLYDVVDVTGTITAGGPQVTVTTTTPGQNGVLTFSGTASQRISLRAVSTISSTISINKPDGSTLTSFSVNGAFGGAFLDVQTLPVTGNYTILVNVTGAATGNTTLTLYNVPADVSGTITPGGSAVTVTIAAPGQNATLTFDGTTGQQISIKFENLSLSNYTATVKKPDGTTLAQSSSGAFIDTKSLPATGTYSIFIDPVTMSVGEVRITVYNVSDVTGTLVINDPAVSVTIAIPGQNAQMTFSGTAGQQITARLTNNTIFTVTLKVLKPDGTALNSFTVSNSSTVNLGPNTLPVTGTYTVVVDPVDANIGSTDVRVSSP